MLFQSILFLFLSNCIFCLDHVDVIFKHYGESDAKTIESLQIFTNLFSNGNQFLTTKFREVSCDSEPENEYCRNGINPEIFIVGTNPITSEEISIQEQVAEKFAETDVISTFRKFAKSFYSKIVLTNIKPVFNPLNYLKKFQLTYDHEFEEKLEKRSKLTFVLFHNNYETFDDWEAVLNFVDALESTKLGGFLVNCHEFERLCETQNVLVNNGPIILAYKNEDVYKKFEDDGDFGDDRVRDWMLTLEQPDITRLSEDAVPYYRSGIIPGFPDTRNTVVMLFTPTKKSVVYQNFAKFAKENHGKFHLTAMVNKEVEKWATQPAFITMKPRDDYIKAFTLHKDITWNRMVEYLEDSQHPSIHQISNARLFDYSISSKPLILFFDQLREKNSTNFRIFASNYQIGERNAHFAVVQGLDLFGLYLSEIFSIQSPTYLSIWRSENGNLCSTKEPIGTDIGEPKILPLIQRRTCDLEIEEFQLPIKRLIRWERQRDLEEIWNNIDGKIVHEEL